MSRPTIHTQPEPGANPGSTSMPPERTARHRPAYGLFMLVLTVYSLVLMVLLLLPVSPAERELLLVYDAVVCVIFLIDFAMNLVRSHPRRDYLVGRRGWLDLLGSIPTFGLFRVTILLRLARISRLLRIVRRLRTETGRSVARDILANRSQYATFITILAALIVLTTASLVVLQFEGVAPNATITTGGDALWWGIVTITTVGYGDLFPITAVGRITAVFVMVAGIGIIGALASILASMLVPTGPAGPAPPDELSGGAAAILDQLAALRAEVAGQRAEIAGLRASLDDGPDAQAGATGTRSSR